MSNIKRGGHKEGKPSKMSLSASARTLAHAGARRGGQARIAALTPEQRSELGRLAARTRWERERAEREAAERVRQKRKT